MYHHTRSKQKDSLAGLTPRERKLASDAWDEANSMKLRDAAMLRRQRMPDARLARLAAERGIPMGEQANRERRAALKAIRDSMEHRIND